MSPLLSVAAGSDRMLQVAGGQGGVPARTTLLRSKTILEYLTDSNRHTRKGMTMRITMNHIVRPPQARPGQTCSRPRAMSRSPLGPAGPRKRPPSCSDHSVGTRALCSFTSTDDDHALRAGSSQSCPERNRLCTQVHPGYVLTTS